MQFENDFKKLTKTIEHKIFPHDLNEIGKSNLKKLLREFDLDLLLECVDISFTKYIKIDDEGNITKESANIFINKIGGIAHNKSLSPIEAKIKHILNKGKSQYYYWDYEKAIIIIKDYIRALRDYGWNDKQILDDLENDFMDLFYKNSNWSSWLSNVEGWISSVKSWNDNDNDEQITQNETILPSYLFEDCPTYITKLYEQINSSYENYLFDCTAVMMRRLVEVLLVFTYRNHKIEDEIKNKEKTHHISLDKMINNAKDNTVIALSSSSSKDLAMFKDLGNFSAHRIYFNCSKKDIEPIIIKYRAIIEELLYKSGLRK